MTVSSHLRALGITGAVQAGSVSITDTDAVQSTVLTITLANGQALTATEGTTTSTTDIAAMTYEASTGSSGSKRIAAALNLANALNANANLTATADTYAVTITEVNGGTGGSISYGGAGGMTVVDWTGGVSSATVNDRGIVMQGGNIAGSKYTNKSILDIVKGADEYGSKLGLVTGTAHKVGLAVARSVGSPAFAFYPKKTDRTAANCTFLARGLQTKIAGAASTENIMGVLGQNQGARGIHLHTDDHYQRGSWATLAFNLFRNPTAGDNSETTGLVQSDGTVKTGATNYGSAAIFRNLADQDNARPVTNVPTRAIPGELVFLVDFVTRSASGGNFKDYSAITGG